ncbi:cellobiose phosphorylase [Pontibacillus sp. ALD_SL1]|uniref:cellobiose phosphorylase n=1 Tax=Pontibacillus sp. ALD_SL1 TaxID=2777185 RepID=UPI0035300062
MESMMEGITYGFDELNRFEVAQYDKAKPFSSFLPGIAGLDGIPMWAFYVNRGQGICSFGIQDKDTPIMEFSPASIAYKNVTNTGFRTFIKCDGEVYEPFSPRAGMDTVERKMTVEANELQIQEVHNGHGIQVNVVYFTMPGEDFAALVRRVEIVNLRPEKRDIEVIDGLPEILPYGVTNAAYKEVGNLTRSWMEVFNLESRIPYYKVRASMEDVAEVREVQGGHFYLSFSEDEVVLPPIIDANVIFGSEQSLQFPERFLTHSVDELLSTVQRATNKVPCGFSAVKSTLDQGGTLPLNTLIGHVSDSEKIHRKRDTLTQIQFIDQKQQEAKQLAEDLTSAIQTKTSSPIFDQYCRHSYLDNVLRGGLPLVLDNGGEGFIYHVYSRKHGDLERDYNFFKLAPEYYSQGNGNFRDMNQNRRNDLYFNPKVGSFNVRMFMNFIQADGYNPLLVEGCQFDVKAEDKEKIIQENVANKQEEFGALLDQPFTPGKLMTFLKEEEVKLKGDVEDVFTSVLKYAEQRMEASFGEGYWVDHWTYNMDLIDNYLSIYPDQVDKLLFEEERYRFFDSPVRISPRKEKYVLTPKGVRQYEAVHEDEEKETRLGIRRNDTNWLRTNHGKGEIYETTLIVKLASLALNKFSLLDAEGMGVEMEANKPGWNDALNGLPGLVGSGMSETFELKRLLTFLVSSLKRVDEGILIPVEMHTLLHGVYENVRLWEDREITDIQYWDRVASLREEYRESVNFGIDGQEASVDHQHLLTALTHFLNKVEQGIEKAKEFGEGLYPTYFYYEAVDYEVIDGSKGQDGYDHVDVKKWETHVLPAFLEGPARAMKVMNDAEDIHSLVRQSDLYDQDIHMFKTSVSLEGQPNEIGRIKAFTPGWLERESVFLHMSYKYLLSLLKAGLYDKFYEEMHDSLVPFLDPAVYGRSTLENSSFIASSVNPDPTLHGQGFVARLSGSTAEFLSMWKYMMMGNGPFIMKEGELSLALSPILQGDLFTVEGEVSFTFLGHTKVTYINSERKDTFGDDRVTIQQTVIVYQDGKRVTLEGQEIEGSHAKAIREGKATSITVYLA